MTFIPVDTAEHLLQQRESQERRPQFRSIAELEPGWLLRQIEATQKESEAWPSWMKTEARLIAAFRSHRNSDAPQR